MNGKARNRSFSSLTPLATALSLVLLAIRPQALAADSPASTAKESPMVRLLKSGRVPEARQGTIVEMIGQRGTADDLGYLYARMLEGAFSPSLRLKVLDALFASAATRKLQPSGDLSKLTKLLSTGTDKNDAAITSAAIRLAGAWKLEPAGEALRSIAQKTTYSDAQRSDALEALATIGGKAGTTQIEALSGPEQPPAIRVLAVAALSKLDLQLAATKAVEVLPAAATASVDLKPLIAPFLNRQGGSDVLASAVSRGTIPADAAKLALRAVYAQGHADQGLVDALGHSAGISTEIKPLTPAELSSLVADVAAKGDPKRGESIFRRADLSCTSCHALSKAGGDVGPDLSAIGQSSPVDYIIYSILLPDQSIKEQYHTQVILTAEGQVFQGIVTDKDNQRIILKEATGATRSVPVASIDEQRAGGSLMPKGLVNLMTRAEFLDLVRFLSELGKPGPYAIQSTPTLQRWHVLKPGMDTTANTEFAAGEVPTNAIHAAADHWSTAYAKVAGGLPLDELLANEKTPKTIYLQGELTVSTAGPITIRVDSAQGIRFWLDDQSAPRDATELTAPLEPGKHTVTLRVDSTTRASRDLKVEVIKPAGSSAEFTVVGGK
jgi:putative heme-binding domain-containing protein